LIVCTNNFAGNISGKQLASYADVAPFSNSSEVSKSLKKYIKSVRRSGQIKSRSGGSVKKILHMGVMSASHCNPEMKQYRAAFHYERKTAEGKDALCVINRSGELCCKKQTGFKSCCRNKKPSPLCG
jgi:transposase